MPPDKQNGFTLIELLTVLIILSTVSFAAVYGFSRLSDYFAFTRIKGKLVSILEECTGLYFQNSKKCVISYNNGILKVQLGVLTIRNETLGKQASLFGGKQDRLKIKFSDKSSGTTLEIGAFDASTLHLCLGEYKDRIIVSTHGRIRFDNNNVSCI